MDNANYKITEDDILKMMKHLRFIAPEHATPEKAIHLLERRKIQLEVIEKLKPQQVEELLKDLEKF